ncbi:MAG: TetR/AcrR family transcriptional regulator [Planctomycetota bacterium]
MNRKEMERNTRQQFVLDAARRVMTRKGIEDTTMEDIASEVEYTRRTLYAYFSSRDEIYLMVLVEDLKARWAEQQKAIATAITGLDKILAWGDSFYAFAREHTHAMRLAIYWDYRGIDKAKISDAVFASFEEINNELAEGLRAIFRLGVSDATLRPDLNQDMCISQFLYSLRSVVSRALMRAYSFAQFEPDDYVAHFLELFTRSIAHDGGKAK